jgi:energy-coupling factor transporter transmembrane protein EcfT
MPRTLGSRLAPWLAAIALIALFAYRFTPLLLDRSDHFVDFATLHGGQLVFELPDSRLNSWILAWVDHALWESPRDLYHPNIHHPEPNGLTGSEHLLGVAAQLLPLEPFLDGAIARHQVALALSAALLAVTTFGAVHWACGSLWAASLAAAFSLGMPWRVTELGHLQLMSVQFFPLVWAGITRCLLGDRSRRTAILLGVAIGLTLLSSFYLAYFLTFSCAVLCLVVGGIARPHWSALGRVVLIAAPGGVLFLLSAIPYLARKAEEQLQAQYDPALSIPPSAVLATLAPYWPHGTDTALLNAPANYWTPWAVLVLAGLATAHALRPSPPSERLLPRRTFTLALAGIVGFALVMMLGGSVDMAGIAIPTPSRLFYEIVPGYSLLRGPTRWGILVGTALPLLAGLGVAAIDERSGHRTSARAAVAVLSAATFAWFPLPTRAAWDNPRILDLRYAAVRELPPGPLLELPWSLDAGDIEYGSRSALASTRHWRPILNGYTGHRPRSYRFLLRIVQRLPDPRAIRQLRRLAGLRYILLDLPRIRRGSLPQWNAAVDSGILRLVHASLHSRIYEIEPAPDTGELTPALLNPAPRRRTFSGLERRALDDPAGRLSLSTPRRHSRQHLNWVHLAIRNASQEVWPGFDIDGEGLVQVRYSYAPRGTDTHSAEDERPETRLVTLDRDIRPGHTANVRVQVQAPRRSGPYVLCVDLVQRFAGSLQPLRIPAVERNVIVPKTGAEHESGLIELIDRSLLRAEAPPPCGSGH